MTIHSTVLVGCLFGTVAVIGCSSAPTESASSSTKSAVSGECAIGGGQCLVGVQNFFNRYGITVGVAGAASYDDQGRYCETYGACHIWIEDIPSRYGWSRTQSPSANDIAVFPPHPGNPYGHITIVEHVDASGAWMIDTNDNNDEVPNNTPHIHYTAPYGYYHYASPSASLEACGSSGGGGAAGGTGNCAGLNDGLYCGSDYVNGDPGTLYRCSAGSISVEESCATGCRTNNDGTNDRCN